MSLTYPTSTFPAAGDPGRLAAYVESVGPLADPGVVPPAATLHLVTFLLGEELFALPVDRVREVVRVGALTRVPQAPEHVRGVQSLRGQILPVLEVKTRLGLPAAQLTARSRILVGESGNRLLGLLVDAVLRVIRIPQAALEPPPPELRSRLSEHIAFMAQLDGRCVLLLDLDRLLLLPASEVAPA